MRLRAEQLTDNLKRSGLAPIYFVSGDEPLQMMETVDEIRHHARKQEFNERIVLDVSSGFDWDTLLQQGSNLSLFSSKRLIELRLGNTKPGNEGGKALIEYVDNATVDELLIITTSRIDKKTQNTRWFKALDNAGITIQIWPVELSNLPGWITRRVKRLNKIININAATLIAERVEGNLLAASQEIDKLCLLVEKNEIEIEDVIASVSDSSRYDVFKLIESSLAGDTRRTVRMLNGLRGEGIDPAAIYGALLWEYRRLCSMTYHFNNNVPLNELFSRYRIWDVNRKNAIRNVLQGHSVKDMHNYLVDAVSIDRQIKGIDRPLVWNALEQFLLLLGGVHVCKQ